MLVDGRLKAEMSEFDRNVNNAAEKITIKTRQGTKIRVDAIGIDKSTGNVIYRGISDTTNKSRNYKAY